MSYPYKAQPTQGQRGRWQVVGSCGTVFDDDLDREDAEMQVRMLNSPETQAAIETLLKRMSR